MKHTYSFLAKALHSGKKLLESEGKTILEVESFGPFQDTKAVPLSSVRMQREIYKKMHLKWTQYLHENDLEEIDLSSTHYIKALRTPKYAIGFSSMYLFYLKQRVEQKVTPQVSSKDLLHPELYLSIAGAYNQGARRLFRAIKKDRSGRQFHRWTRYQSRVGETRDYISSIRNCMRSEKSSGGAKGFAASSLEKSAQGSL